MGWYREKKSQEVEKYFAKYKLTPGYFTGAWQPWMDPEDTATRVAGAASVIDLRSGAIIYSSGTQACNAKAILDAIDKAK